MDPVSEDEDHREEDHNECWYFDRLQEPFAVSDIAKDERVSDLHCGHHSMIESDVRRETRMFRNATALLRKVKGCVGTSGLLAEAVEIERSVLRVAKREPPIDAWLASSLFIVMWFVRAINENNATVTLVSGRALRSDCRLLKTCCSA